MVYDSKLILDNFMTSFLSFSSPDDVSQSSWRNLGIEITPSEPSFEVEIPSSPVNEIGFVIASLAVEYTSSETATIVSFCLSSMSLGVWRFIWASFVVAVVETHPVNDLIPNFEDALLGI